MDMEKFKEDLACALGRPEEWRFDSESRFLVHTSTGIRVSSYGQVYRSETSGTTDAPYHQICSASLRATTYCRGAVVKREAESRRKNETRDRQAFLDSFLGFQS